MFDAKEGSLLKFKLDAIQKQLQLKIDEIRASLKHHGNKGNWAESAFRDVLKQFLPRLYDIGHGEIINSSGYGTGQVDVVVTNQYHPLMYPNHIPGIFFVEGVVAIGEVKMQLTSSHLEKFLKDANHISRIKKSVKPLMSSVPSSTTATARSYSRRPIFLFAYESELSLEGVFKKVTEWSSQGFCAGDAIFLLDRGCLIDFGDGNEALQATNSNGQKLQGWGKVNNPRVLLNLFLWLDAVIPRESWELTPWISHYLFEKSHKISNLFKVKR